MVIDMKTMFETLLNLPENNASHLAFTYASGSSQYVAPEQYLEENNITIEEFKEIMEETSKIYEDLFW